MTDTRHLQYHLAEMINYSRTRGDDIYDNLIDEYIDCLLDKGEDLPVGIKTVDDPNAPFGIRMSYWLMPVGVMEDE